MARIVQDVRSFRADAAWGARDLVEIEGATARLHWTDQPYRWHVNDGAELFCVLDGEVDMRYRIGDAEHVVRLRPSDIFVADVGDAHVAHPVGEARILVFERKGSV
ncbi:cupin domain-containing protein [Sphingomonas hengshuiensis]|uniref:Cupin n=1 Tax=Sphingomonas hengshuiensis TaxID=1609977 RepID=A0A7U4LF82_9SPHN|nr:cupin [Sphingomonas hengshuiensis]AJP71879.1 cupin [Sphingomonas hengshuiensis]